jgi:hypothetical protein
METPEPKIELTIKEKAALKKKLQEKKEQQIVQK